jgi:hypothetical protein
LRILGGIVNDTGEIEELWERFMVPRRPKKRQGGRRRRRCEEMGLLCFSLPFPILMILAGIFMEVTCRGRMFPPCEGGNLLGYIDDSSGAWIIGLGLQMGTDC